MAIIKLLVYGEVFSVGIGAERAAHFFEYTGEMFNCVFAFIFVTIRLDDIKNQLIISLYGDPSRVANHVKCN